MEIYGGTDDIPASPGMDGGGGRISAGRSVILGRESRKPENIRNPGQGENDMIASIVIGTFIFAYAGYVIFRKVREWKAGRFCSCGCESCQMKCYGRKQDGGNQ